MILVTGGTGFLGAHLLAELCSKGEKIRVLKRNSSDLTFVKQLFDFNSNGSFGGIEWVDGDILDTESLKPVMKGVSQVYHCAGLVSFSKKESRNLFKINVRGTANIVNTALENGVKNLCYVSSVAALGSGEFINEDTLWDTGRDNSPYAESKHQAEMEIMRAEAEGLDVLIVRPSVIIGPCQQNNLISNLSRLISKGFKYYTPGSSGFVDVRDVAKAMIQLMQSTIKNESFIISSENLSYKEIFTIIAEQLNKPVPHIPVGKTVTGLLWRFVALKDFITGKDSGFNKTTANFAHTILKYSNKKLCETLSFSYIPIRESIINSDKYFKFYVNTKS